LDDILKLALGFLGGGSAVGITLGILVQLNKLDTAIHFLYRIGTRVSCRFTRGRDATYIQREINRSCARLEYDAPGSIPLAPKIRWVAASGLDSIRENEVIICLAPDQTTSRSLVKATLQYLPLGMVKEARPYMPRAESEAMDLAVARDIVVNDVEAQRILMQEYVAPASRDLEDFDKWMGIFARLTGKGLFSRVFLPEIGSMGRFLSPHTSPNQELMKEAEEVAYFVNGIARREEHEEIRLALPGPTVRTGAILFARSFMLDTYGEAAHWWRLRQNLRMGLHTVYLIAWTKRGMEAAELVARRALREGLISCYREKRFAAMENGQRVEDLVIACAAGESVEEVPTSSEEQLADACHAAIPELADDTVEIVALAREPGQMSVVAIRTNREGYDLTPVIHQSRANLVARDLENELVRIIPWSDDPIDVISSILRLVRYQDIHTDYDRDRREFLVGAPDEKIQKAIQGEQGVALHLASQITGWKIMTTVSKA